MARRRPRDRGRRALRDLADRAGIIAEYIDQTGRERRATKDRTRVALLAAMGYDVSSDEAVARSLSAFRAEEEDRVLPPIRVTTDAGEPIPCRLPRGWSSRAEWELEITDEQGRVTREAGRSGIRPRRRIEIRPRRTPGLGYHSLRLTVEARGAVAEGRQRLVVVPPRFIDAQTVLGGERAVGLTANLYAVRSGRNWGVGDIGDLRALSDWAAQIGAAFIGVNPLHALRNAGRAISPYGPVSRLFRNVIYLDVEAVPEYAESGDARAAFERVRPRVAELRNATHIDYEKVMSAKRPVLEALHRAFVERHRDRDTPRGREYAAYLEAQGEPLDAFATWCVLDEKEEGRPWTKWPADLRDPKGAAVRSFRERERERVDFHRWLQFELDRQLGEAQHHAKSLGLPIGLYQDLAIGAAPDGSDTWMNRGLFLDSVAIGAPPDPYAIEGQNWGLPPINPHRLAADGYGYWIALVRAALRHGGALRIDHVLGLFRQYWIPEGMRGADGAYVRFPANDLLGILALESLRANALVVGEDLGTVPPEVPPALDRWGMLSSKVLYFEMDGKHGRFKPPESYPRLALTTANTHDMPSIAAFWREHDIDLRAKVGAIPTKRAVANARKERASAREALAVTLVDEGLWPASDEPKPDATLRGAVHALLRRTPSWLVGLSLDDLAGEVEPVNLPGVPPDRWPSWTRRMAMSLEELTVSPDVQRALGVERRWIPQR